MKEKFDAFNNKVETIINDLEMDEKTKKKLETQVKKEFENYKKDIVNENIDLYDEKPFIQKIVFLLVGILSFPVGYALYFLIKDNKTKKWQANYLVKGATAGLFFATMAVVLKIIYEFAQTVIVK